MTNESDRSTKNVLSTLSIQEELRNTAGSVPDHPSRADTITEHVTPVSGFPVYIKVTFTLYCRLLGVQ